MEQQKQAAIVGAVILILVLIYVVFIRKKEPKLVGFIALDKLETDPNLNKADDNSGGLYGFGIFSNDGKDNLFTGKFSQIMDINNGKYKYAYTLASFDMIITNRTTKQKTTYSSPNGVGGGVLCNVLPTSSNLLTSADKIPTSNLYDIEINGLFTDTKNTSTVIKTNSVNDSLSLSYLSIYSLK